MKRACIAIVDAAHARSFTDQQIDQQEPTLHEERDLVNPGRQGGTLFSDPEPGNRWQEGGRGSTDDHRTEHIADLDGNDRRARPGPRVAPPTPGPRSPRVVEAHRSAAARGVPARSAHTVSDHATHA
ncbi:MAG: hypothetical protein M3680_00625 [Myxococcota bacterium]|nr:hypothetical protein [Myxococcota bacterium]